MKYFQNVIVEVGWNAAQGVCPPEGSMANIQVYRDFLSSCEAVVFLMRYTKSENALDKLPGPLLCPVEDTFSTAAEADMSPVFWRFQKYPRMVIAKCLGEALGTQDGIIEGIDQQAGDANGAHVVDGRALLVEIVGVLVAADGGTEKVVKIFPLFDLVEFA